MSTIRPCCDEVIYMKLLLNTQLHMPSRDSWDFRTTVGYDLGLEIPGIYLEDCEVYVLWTLGKCGPRSIYALSKASNPFPTVTTSIFGPSLEHKRALGKKPPNYSYTAIHKSANSLERKGLTHTIRYTHGPQSKRIVGLTFIGLILYLQNSNERDRFEKVFTTYPDLIPFSPQWNLLNERIGKQKCIEDLEKTVKRFVALRRARFTLKPLKTVFEGYLQPNYSLCRKNRNKDVAEFLEDKEVFLLLKSYIAYLACHDIDRLSILDNENIKEVICKLDSEEELAYFEKRDISANPLFRGKRLKKFLPEYAKLEYFFTGMYVATLLWHENKIESLKQTDRDYEVEYFA